MPRPVRWLLWALAISTLGAAFWVLMDDERGSQSPEPAREQVEQPRNDELAAHGGVGARTVHAARGSDIVAAQIVDVDGQPVVEGRVLLSCAATGKPLRGSLRLDEEGRFQGPGCDGPVCAQLQHPSLIQDDVWMLEPGIDAVLQARPLESLMGTVVGPTGEPVSAAKIVVVPEVHDPTAVDPFVSRQATTDEHGEFRYMRVERPPCDPCAEASGRCAGDDAEELPTFAGTLLLGVTAPGHRYAELQVDSGAEGPLEIRLSAPAEPLVGELLDATGEAYPRARALLRSQTRPRERHAAEVGEDGGFRFADLGDGSYDLRIVQDGVELATRQAVHAGDRVELRGEPASGGPDLEITVVDAAGKAVSGAVVDGGPFHGARTDVDGLVAAEAVLEGSYKLRVRVPQGASVRQVVEVPGSAQIYRVEVRIPPE